MVVEARDDAQNRFCKSNVRSCNRVAKWSNLDHCSVSMSMDELCLDDIASGRVGFEELLQRAHAQPSFPLGLPSHAMLTPPGKRLLDIKLDFGCQISKEDAGRTLPETLCPHAGRNQPAHATYAQLPGEHYSRPQTAGW